MSISDECHAQRTWSEVPPARHPARAGITGMVMPSSNREKGGASNMKWIQALRTNTRLRRIVTRTSVLAVGLALMPLLPQAAQATTYTINPVSVKATAPMTGNTANQADANCQNDGANSGNDVVVGGGVFETISADGVMADNAQRLEGSGPSPDGTSFASGTSDTNDQYWIGVDGVGGMTDPNGAFEVWALCDNNNTLTGSSGTKIVENDLPYPSTSLSANPVGASCPPGTKLLSGGAYVTNPWGSLKPIASYPFVSSNGKTTPSLYPAASGS